MLKLALFRLSVLFVCLGPAIRTGYAQSAVQRLDDKILLDIAAGRTQQQNDVFLFLSRTNNYVNYGVPLGMMTAGILSGDKITRQNAVYVASSSLVSFAFTNLMKVIIKRPRPFVKNVNIVPLYRAGGYSLPSGHTSSSFTTATALTSVYPKWYVAVPSYLWAGAVSYSRLYIGVHNPSDVAAGAVSGTGAAIGMGFLRKEPRMPTPVMK